MSQSEYSTRQSLSSSALSEWVFIPQSNYRATVIPDGCQDIIVKGSLDKGCQWFQTQLDTSAYSVPAHQGNETRGIRLKPGVVLVEEKLNKWMQANHPLDLFKSDQLDEFCVVPPNLTTALECLASGELSVNCVASELGVSLRTLQRLVKTNTGKPAYFWFSLSRIRRVARAVIGGEKLVDIAMQHGFSDQAHMQRELKKWFLRTPLQLRQDAELHVLLNDLGYG